MITANSACRNTAAASPRVANAPSRRENPWATALLGTLRYAWRFRARLAVITAEMALVALAYVLTIRIFGGLHSVWAADARRGLPYMLLIQFVAFAYFGTFKTMLRHASIADALRIAESVGASALLFAGFAPMWLRRIHIPRGFYVFDALVLLFLLLVLHFAFRAGQAHRALARRQGKRVVIIGAGDAGATVARELALGADSQFLPVAILDDDSLKHGADICGIPVAGALGEISRIVREKRAAEILVCIPSATRAETRRILMACLDCQVPVRTLPSVRQLADGRVSQKDLRRIQIDDVLAREEIACDPALASAAVGGKVVLVTGAGGTIGAELCRQIAAAKPRTLLLLDKSENSLFYTHLELTERFPELAMKPLLMDIVRGEAIRSLFAAERPQIVFHAAAHKHVGLLELHPPEAIRNNVLGTRNVLLAAAEIGVECLVNVSTDKAVNPRCFMGLSKKLTEMLTREIARARGARFMNVRFGNVAGSNGSVLRIFWEHVEKKKPLRVTDPCATRYFMRVSEAVALMLRAALLGRGGETFILEMGKPVNIYELARAVSLLSGYVPEEELPIEFIGLRQGEKLHEELWENWEEPRATEIGEILVISKTREPVFSVLEETRALERILQAGAEPEVLIGRLSARFPAFAANRVQKNYWGSAAEAEWQPPAISSPEHEAWPGVAELPGSPASPDWQPLPGTMPPPREKPLCAFESREAEA